MALLTNSQQRRVNRVLRAVGRVFDIAGRIQYLDTNGIYYGPSTGVNLVVGGVGGIAAGDIVYASGYDSTTGYAVVLPADADSATVPRDLFYCPAAIAAEATGYAYKSGRISGVNTNSAAAVGSPIYLHTTAGEWSVTSPSGTAVVVEVGTVLIKDASVGVVHIDLPGETIRVHTHADNSQGGTLSTVDLAGTTSASFQVNSAGHYVEISSTGQTSDHSFTFPDASSEVVTLIASQTLTNKTLTTPTIGDLTNATHTHADAAGGGNTLTIPTIGDFTNATHTHADAAGGGNTLTIPTIADFTNATHDHSSTAKGGTLASIAGLTGTTNATFTILSGGNQLILSSSGLGANRTFTFPDASDQVAGIAAAQTLASKTLTSPHLGGGALTLDAAVTVSGTWTNLGVVTTVDINGGTADGMTIGGAAAGAGSFTTLGSTGTATLNDATVGGGYGSAGVTLSAAGVIQANGAITTDGALTAASMVCTAGATFGGGYGAAGCTITPNGLLAGDILDIEITTVVNDGGGTTGAQAQIGLVQMLLDVKG